MVELINPFLGFKNPLEKKGHNPYRFNPFIVLEITKDEIDAESIVDKAEAMRKEIEFSITSKNSSGITAAEQANISNAQHYLAEPLQRLAFELLIPDLSTDNINVIKIDAFGKKKTD